MKSSTKKTNGFAMLFTVLIMSIILTIAVGISNQTYKQTILSSLAKDSQIAFYQADRGTECGMYYDLTLNTFPRFDPNQPTNVTPSSIRCGESPLELDPSSSQDYYVFVETPNTPSDPCLTLIFDKTTSISKVIGRGYNVCTDSPRRVERQLEVHY